MAVLLSLLTTTACVALAYWCNRRVRGFLPDDIPQAGRKNHGRRVPLAGIALLPPVLLALCLHGAYVLAGAAAVVAALGFVDDWHKELGRDLDWRAKFVGLGIAAAAVAGTTSDPFGSPLEWALAWSIVFVAINAANFLDNTDGVSAAVCGTGLLLAGAGSGAWAAVGAAAMAFLLWNWPRPRLFLGDSGAYLLGICAGAAAASAPPDVQALAPFALLFVDFAQVVMVRIALGLPPWVGDRRHLTHIAQNLGVARVAVAPLFAALALGIGVWVREAA